MSVFSKFELPLSSSVAINQWKFLCGVPSVRGGLINASVKKYIENFLTHPDLLCVSNKLRNIGSLISAEI